MFLCGQFVSIRAGFDETAAYKKDDMILKLSFIAHKKCQRIKTQDEKAIYNTFFYNYGLVKGKWASNHLIPKHKHIFVAET